jgi:PIN domain nuclease of toxin-antitoxin system
LRHGDPSDRLLVAEALEDDLTIVSADRVFRQYGVAVIW